MRFSEWAERYRDWAWRRVMRPALWLTAVFGAYHLVARPPNTWAVWSTWVAGIAAGALIDIPIQWAWRRVGGPRLATAVRQAWQVGVARLYRVLDRLGL